MGHFEPIHDAHAIDQVGLVLQFNGPIPLNESGTTAVWTVADAFKDELPASTNLQPISLWMGAAPPGLRFPVSGRALASVQRDGTIERELRVDLTSIAFRSMTYTRWDAVWKQVSRYFDVLMPAYLAAGVALSGISLNFVDKFVWSGELAEMRPKSLLRPRSQYVAPHVYEASDLWHCYTGAFTRIDGFVKRLLNINIDCLEDTQTQTGATRRLVSITTVVTDMLNQPGYARHIATEQEATAFVQQQFQALHAFSKSELMAVIDDHMCKRIGLEAK